MARRSRHVEIFVRVADARAAEAARLLEGGLTLGAVYLAGYEIECLLKALLLSVTPFKDQAAVLEEFRGKAGHNLIHLRDRYLESGGAAVPPPVGAALLILVNNWSTDLRYHPGIAYSGGVGTNAYFAAVAAIASWARQRI